MKIGVELVHISEGVTGGLAPLLRGVLEALFSGWPEHDVVLFYQTGNRPLFANLPPHVQALHLPAGPYFPLLDAYAAQLRLDVLLRTYPADVELAFPLERQVVVIPDIQHEYYPEFFTPEVLQGRRAGFAQALGRAGAIATLSEHARQTLLAHPAGKGADIFLTPPALSASPEGPEADALSEAERALLPAHDYFFYPANLWPHKNHRRVLQAFARFVGRATRPFELVLTGHPDGWDEMAKDFPGLPARHLGFVRRGVLQALLARARALVFFSLFEGFGMPLLEAFAAGVPVACSHCTSLPEVGGDAVLTCDPTDVEAMSEAMALVASDEPLRARLVARGKERLRCYDWRDSAAQLMAAFARVDSRTPSPSATPFPTVSRLNQLLHEIDADRAARLDVIQRLDADRVKQLEVIQRLDADRAARLDVIQRLEVDRATQREVFQQAEADRAARLDVIHRLAADLAQSEADRAAGQEAIHHLQVERDAAQQEIARLSRGVFQRLAARLPGPMKQALRAVARADGDGRASGRAG